MTFEFEFMLFASLAAEEYTRIFKECTVVVVTKLQMVERLQ